MKVSSTDIQGLQAQPTSIHIMARWSLRTASPEDLLQLVTHLLLSMIFHLYNIPCFRHAGKIRCQRYGRHSQFLQVAFFAVELRLLFCCLLTYPFSYRFISCESLKVLLHLKVTLTPQRSYGCNTCRSVHHSFSSSCVEYVLQHQWVQLAACAPSSLCIRSTCTSHALQSCTTNVGIQCWGR